MEIRGEKFIKKVQLKQEKNEIEQRLTEIKNAQAVYEEPVRESTASILEREIGIQEEQEYSDIMLGKHTNSNELNKKKYLVLGLILVILFLLTIIIIRLLTSDSSSNNSFAKYKNENVQNILENENIEEEYQKIINEKLKNIKEENIKEEKRQEIKNEKIVDEKLNLKVIEKNEQIIEQTEVIKADMFNTKNIYTPSKKVAREEVKFTKIIKEAKIIKKEKTKKVLKKAINKSKNNKVLSLSFNKPKGTFVQIGAFSKIPTNKYLSSITKHGFKYKIYKIKIKNKIFHKLLIGPYNSREQAKLETDNIKKKLNISSTFILTF